MKKSLKSALSLLGLSSTLLVTSLPLVTSCTTSINRSSYKLSADEPTSTQASKFLSGGATGTVWYTIDDTNNTVSLVMPNDQEPDTLGNNLTFIDQPTLNANYYLTTIGDTAFDGKYDGKLTGTLTFNEHLSVIKEGAFQMQTVSEYNFKNLSYKSGLKIENKAFYKNNSLTKVVMPDNLTSNIDFGTNCFQGCTSLTAFHFPTGTKTIDINAFADCSTLSTVTFANKDVNSIKNMDIRSGIFANCNQLTKIQVPEGTKSAYEEVLDGKIPSSIAIEETYTPTPTPSEDKTWTVGKIVAIVVGCVLGVVGISLLIALPILKKKGKLNRKKRQQLKKPLPNEDNAIKEKASSKKYQVNKILEGRKCPYCQHPLVVRKNKKGQKFIGCTNYPRCKYTKVS